MGQYYKPVFLAKNNKPLAYVNSYDFGSGKKLSEHSWRLNDFVGFVEQQLVNQPQRIVWAGDYAKPEPIESLTKEEIRKYLQVNSGSGYYSKEKIAEDSLTLYSLCDIVARLTDANITDPYEHNFNLALPKRFKYLINYDKKEFVNKDKVPSEDGWQKHPLPLLTNEGNGQGGGDFGYDEIKLNGVWARDLIGVSSKKADIKDFKELIFNIKP